MNDSIDKVAMQCMLFDKIEDVWQLKWPLVSHLVQLTSLACEVSHDNQFLPNVPILT